MAGENAVLRSFTDRSYVPLNVTLSGTKTKGDIDVIENNAGFYLEDGVSGDLRTFVIGAQKANFPKTVGDTFKKGDDLFFNDVTKKLTLNNALRPIGVCENAAGSGAATADFYFHQEASGTY